MPEYTILIRNGPSGYADTDEENVQVDNEEELAAAVKKHVAIIRTCDAC